MSKKVRLPDDSNLPDIPVFGKHAHVAAFLVYVDDFLAAGPRDVLQPLLTRLRDVWKGSNPHFLGRQTGDVDTMQFLGFDIELGPEEGTWLVHQQSYIYAFLQEMFDPECLKDRRTPGEPESFSDKRHVEPHAPSTTSTRTGTIGTYSSLASSWCTALGILAHTSRYCMGGS